LPWPQRIAGDGAPILGRPANAARPTGNHRFDLDQAKRYHQLTMFAAQRAKLLFQSRKQATLHHGDALIRRTSTGKPKGQPGTIAVESRSLR
jgi:hypothetical protein